MKRLVNTLGALALVAMFLLPVAGFAGLLLSGVELSENRAAAAWPEWGADDTPDAAVRPGRAYAAGIDAFLEDRFGGRMALIRLSRRIKDNLGEDPPLVARGQGEWLFLSQANYKDEFEGVGRWTDAQVEQWVESTRDAAAVFEERGIPFALSIAPDKIRIYPEQAPDNWRQGGRRFRTTLLEDPRVADIAFDAEVATLARKSAGERVYHARDTHWTLSGGLPFVTAFLDRIDPQGRRLRYEASPKEIAARKRPWDLEVFNGQEASSQTAARYVPPPSVPGMAVEAVDADGDGVPDRGALQTKIITRRSTPETEGTLVIVGDSFSDVMAPVFAHSFDRVVKIHHGGNQFTVGTDEILSFEPDAVLVLIVEREAAAKAAPLRLGPTRVDAG